MSKTFKRPMFRKGGNVGTGIMTGVVDRSMHADNPIVTGNDAPVDYEKMFIEKTIGAGGMPEGMDPLTSYLLAAGPKMASSTSFADMISNLEGPNKALIEQQNKKAEAMRNLRTGAASFGLEAQLKKDLLKQEWDAREKIAGMNETGMDPFKLGSYEKFRKDGDTHTVAKNKANYDVDMEEKLTAKIDRNRVGGIIDIDITDQKKFIDWATNKKVDRVGKIFYDPRDGMFKQLTKTSQGYSFKMFGPTVDSVVLERETRIPHKDKEKKRSYGNPPKGVFGTGIGQQIPAYMLEE
jgi:hypothetical protein